MEESGHIVLASSLTDCFAVFSSPEYSKHERIKEEIRTFVAKTANGTIGELEALEALEKYRAMGFVIKSKDPNKDTCILTYHHVFRKQDDDGNDLWFASFGVPTFGFTTVSVIEVDPTWFTRGSCVFLVPPVAVVTLSALETAGNIRTIMHDVFDEHIEEDNQVLDAFRDFILDTEAVGVTTEEMELSALTDDVLISLIKAEMWHSAFSEVAMERAMTPPLLLLDSTYNISNRLTTVLMLGRNNTYNVNPQDNTQDSTSDVSEIEEVD